MKSKLVVGIDVSKSFLDYSEVHAGTSKSAVFDSPVIHLPNTHTAIGEWVKKYDPNTTLFVFEPTGTYSDKLMTILHTGGFAFSLVNPRQSHNFSQVMGILHKDDAQAARTLAYMGCVLELSLAQPPSEVMKKHKQLLTTLNGHLQMEQSLKNRLHALEQYHTQEPVAIESLKRILSCTQEEITHLREQINQLDDQEFNQRKALAMTVSGVGSVTAEWLLLTTDGLRHFHSANQLIKYCGLAPQSHYSGDSVAIKGGISKQACAKIRACLYMAAKSAIRHNLACKHLYQRLRAKGKPYFKAMVAVMNKLLKQVFAVVKSGIPYDKDYHIRWIKN